MSYEKDYVVDYPALASSAGIKRADLSLSICDRLQDKEPEPKLWVPGTSSFIKIREMLDKCADTSIIHDTVDYSNNPLLSILVDVRKNGDPKLTIGKANRDLRFRGNISPEAKLYDIDWCEKSRNHSCEKSNGLAVRDEVELEIPKGYSIEDGFRLFQQESIGNNRGAVSETLSYKNLFPKAGYLSARTTYEVAQRVALHENGRTYDFLIIYEACEDITTSLDSRLGQTYHGEILEFEIEAKKIIGKVPPRLWKSNEDLQDVITRNLTLMRDVAHVAATGSDYNERSKAETAISHLQDTYIGGLDLTGHKLSEVFQERKYKGFGRPYSAEEFSILMGRSIEKTLNSNNPYWAKEQAPLVNAAGMAGYLSGLRLSYQIESAEQHFLIEPEKVKKMGIEATLRNAQAIEARSRALNKPELSKVA